VVGLEVLDKFLRGASGARLAVFLVGARPDLLAALNRFGIADAVPRERIFPEEDENLSATLKAIRSAQALHPDEASGDARRAPADGVHYLV
jgi:SulP family sulfate permease